ncbi:MAG: Oligopeptide transport system permease protein OppC (TC 3.A.1.5.1) [uncultured Thiotrichaceae bacterium]|uniref:Oligopeptide transport system permease protein OppC n=1 Tax=uncultured Thiotrichaceae bacterium TaxID=298394 RepID=A0A6S6SH40_9GAMM|nr:MAG: Oligopeptide transport system permease protein OppC (TC 3.A.1.5.1) [uncultured Thiotrichaceae bacterium]
MTRDLPNNMMTPGQKAWRRWYRNKAAMTSVVILSVIVLLCVFGPMLSPWSFDEPDWDNIGTPPDFSTHHYFGTDENGRDLFVRTLHGGRISLMVGLLATLVSFFIGVIYGAIAGYRGGKTDALMMRFVDVLYALPFMFFVILLTVYFGRSIWLIFIAIGAVEWLTMARIVRGQSIALKQRAFIEAARMSGASAGSIIRRHIIPNSLGPVIVYATLTVPQVILFESFLSFLGLGVQEPMSSWGVLIVQGSESMESAPWMLLFPASFLVITLFCLNFMGDGLRDALDPKDR